MSALKTPSSPEQAKLLLDESIKLTDRKGFRFVTGSGLHWHTKPISVPERVRERAGVDAENANNFQLEVDTQLGATAINELAVITFTNLDVDYSGFEAIRYMIVPRTSLQDLSIECHEHGSIFPRIPDERDPGYSEEGRTTGDFPEGLFDDPASTLVGLYESAMVNVLRYEIENEEREAKARAAGQFTTWAAEAEELIAIVRNFAEA